MKKRLTLAILASLVCAANGAITVQFSDNNNALTNFLNGAGTGTTAMVWGLVVDTAGDGFAGSNALTPYDEGFSLAATSNPLNMTVSNGLATDDRLFIAAGFLSVNATVVDDAAVGINRALSMTSMNLTSGVAFGQSFAVIWFDSTTRVATTEGLKYGIFTPPTSNVGLANTTTANKLPGADGSYSYASVFDGPDAAKNMAYTLGVAVPEASTALLGALGALGLLRRRR